MSETERSAATSSSRIIKLLCPSIWKKKIVELMVWDDHLLDLGLISRTFGLDPATLKVNRHFITKGVDLISTSITWRSLVSFFASRGFPNGVDPYSPLIVDGKLCKSGTKRVHDPSSCSIIPGRSSDSQDVSTSKKKRIGDDNYAEIHISSNGDQSSRFSLFEEEANTSRIIC